MAPHDLTIQRLCQNDFTRHEAKRLYSVAFQRTGKNTGHDLGDGHSALAQICAFLASETTGRGDVTQEQARANACLDVKTFDYALQVVKRVVSNSSAVMGLKRVTYSSLVRQYEIREDASVAMLEVAQTLKQNDAFYKIQLELESPVVQCAIFHWVCTKVFELAVPAFPVYHELYKISQQAWSLALRLLDKHCSPMVKFLASLAKTATPSTRTRRQTRSQSQQSALALPNNGKHPLDNISPRKPALVKAMKGKGRKEPNDVKEVETPPKRHKGSTYMPSPLGQDQHTITPIIKRGNTAATPDRKGKHHTSSYERDVINNTPMTSTGLSDVFSDSPSSSRSARPVIRARFRSPSPAAVSSPPEEEIPRIRRRNLRAPFLDRAAYSWTPSSRTKERLERARNLEALMNSKYGDPWDEL